MRTIPRRFPGKKVAGNYRAECVQCGGAYYRDKLFRRPVDGKLQCRATCARGREAPELARLASGRAAEAAEFGRSGADRRDW